MKRFTKMLALGMAMALAFGMTVSASGDPVNPSGSTTVVETPDGITAGPVADEEAVFDACKKAVEQDGVLAGKFGTAMQTFQLIDMVDLQVEKPGKVAFTLNTGLEGRSADYGFGWGYILLHFVDGNLDAKPEVISLGKEGNRYTANVKSGSPYAVVLWRLAWHNSSLAGLGRDTYQDQHTAARKAIEVDGIGDTVAQEYKNKDYKFYQTMDSVVLSLAEDSTVEFPLANIDGNYGYVVLCYNDMQNIAGYPSRHFELTKTAENTYSGKLPKGEYVAVVIKVTNVPGSAPAPTTPVDTNVTAPSIQGGAQAPAAGVVSPKTGEALPMAVVLAAICLAGAAVCAKKARCNG